MKTKTVVEILDYSWFKHYLNPTGRFKFEVINGVVSMYIEHKALLFKHWIREDDLFFVEIGESEIFECSSGK